MLDKCPGIYCGRSPLGNNTWSACGACPRGYRVNNSYACIRCNKDPSTYDWLYLGFMMILPLIFHWFSIDMAAKARVLNKEQIIIYLSAFIEVVISAVLTIFLSDPLWSFKINSCGVSSLSDWYTLFRNPTPQYESKLYCTQEAVYPLQTIVLCFYLLCVITMMIIRPFLNQKFMKNGKTAVYSALYFFPILSLLHTVAGGLMYYAFPYLSIILSMLSNAAHFSIKLDQTMKSLLKSSVLEIKNSIIILGHWLLLAYGIVSLRQHLATLAFVPLPALFYIVTVKFTNPNEFRDKDRDDRNTN